MIDRIVKKAVHGGNLRQAAAQYGIDSDSFLDFSANISYVGPPPGIEEAIQRGISVMKHYPDPDSKHLTSAIAQAVHLPDDHILVGNGSIELLYALMRSLGKCRALVTEPTFSEYARAVQVVGGDVDFFPLSAREDWRGDLSALAKRLSHIDLVFLCNPNNPTGEFIARAELVNFIEQAKKSDVLVVVDEAFVDFVEDFDQEEFGVLSLVTTFNNLVVLRSFTKFFAIPGLRLGFCAAAPPLIGRIQGQQEPWTVNCIAQSVGEHIVSPKLASFREHVRRDTQRTRIAFKQNLEARCQVACWGQVNYLLLDLGEAISSTALTEQLGKRGILVRDCRPYAPRLGHYLRVAVRAPEENGRLVTELAPLLQAERRG